MEALRRIRTMRGMNQVDLARASGVAQNTISEIELGKREARPGTLKKLADALDVEIADLFEDARPPLGPAPPSPTRSPLNGFEEERRARWDADVQEARQLRITGRPQMQRALDAWRESKDRGEPDAIREKHLAEIGVLLKEAYDAQKAVGGAYVQAAIKQSSDAPLPAYLREESGAATDFYIDLWRLVQDAGLSIRTSSKQAGKQAGEQAEPEKRPTRIVDDAA